MEKYLIKVEMLHCSGKKYFAGKFFFLLFIIALSSFGQITSRKDKRLFFKADKEFDYGDYLNAKNIYDMLYIKDSLSDELNYKLGVCNYEIRKFRDFSRKYFEKTSTEKFPEVNYYLGLLYHSARNYDKAIHSFNEYKNAQKEKEHLNKEVNYLIEKCYTAMLFEATVNETVIIENMGKAVNTEYPEYAPLVPADETYMLFTSRRQNSIFQDKDPLGDYYEDIYISRKDSAGNWQVAQILDTVINTNYHDACTGLSADGEKLLLYRTSKDHIGGHIYESFLVNNKWSIPQVLNANVNSSDYIETSACYSADGTIIFFSSNRPGGYGGKDLYSVKKLPNGHWGKPMNLGPTINTEYNEDAPYVHPSGNLLFFSSEGHKNMGGYDVFKSVFDDKEVFTPPENLGYPVNTVDDDIFFVLNTDASIGYLSSHRSDGYGTQDIYRAHFSENNIPLYVYNIHVVDVDEKIVKNVEILLTDMKKKEVYGSYKSNPKTGKTIIISKPNKEYRVAIQAKGYDPVITNCIFDGENRELILKLPHKTQ